MSDKHKTSGEADLLVADNKRTLPPTKWRTYQKILFRIAFPFFILMSIPLSSGWYKNLATIDWFSPHYRDIYDIARFSPSVRGLFGASRGGGEDGAAAIAGPPAERNSEGRSADKKEQRKGGRSKDRSASKKQDTSGSVAFASAEDGQISGRKNNATSDAIKKSAARAKNNQAAGAGELPRNRSFLSDYTDWGIILLISTVIGLIWTAFDRKRQEYNVLYYWLKVVVRYRAAIGIIGFGFTKLFPTQMPYPSLGLLNTDFGDFTAQKIYWLSVGIVPWYQVFGGVVELLAGGLLLFRKTTTYGAILLIGALGDITYVNYAYDGGVHVYAFYFVLLGAFLIVDDVPRLYNLLIRRQYTVPSSYYPYFTKDWLGYTRIGLKSLTFIIFFGVLTYTEIINFVFDPYKQPSTAGVKNLRGNYAVTEFRLNDSIIPYSPIDSTRWQQATFENWTTLTFKVNRPVYVDPSNGGGSPMRDIQRTFEIAGTAGGQRAFHYYADTIEHVLYLQDKNAVAALRNSQNAKFHEDSVDSTRSYPKNWISEAAWKNIGDENKMIDKRAYSTRRDREFARPARDIGRSKMVLNYTTTDGSRVILKGLDENRDSLYIVLDRVERKYNLSPSSLSAGKY